MNSRVLIVHAKNEEGFVQHLAGPIRAAGYEVAHQGTVLVGESVVAEMSRVLADGCPVVLCGTERAAGNTWVKRLVRAARQKNKGMLFIVQMEEEADLEAFSFGEKIGAYWKNPAEAITELVSSLQRYYPLDEKQVQGLRTNKAEQHYRDLLLETCDIINLANLPEQDRHIAQKQQELKLRGLYIPLRVQVEATATAESSELAIQEEVFDKLETRRDRFRHGLIGTVSESGDRPRVPMGERLANAKRLVILGDPGSGKTTLTRWVATAYLLKLKRDKEWQELPDVRTLPDEDWLPIIIRCRDLDSNSLSGSLNDILKHILRKSELGEEEGVDLRRQLQLRIASGQALLMLDGLDEITDPAARVKFCQQLEQIVVAHPDTPIIATSRIVGYREMGYKLGRGFEHLTLADLVPEEKDEFARRWCMLTEVPERRDTAAQELIHDIHSAERIEQLTGNPMLLTTMALVKRKVGKLPNRRAELYWEAVQVLLNWRREVDEPIEVREAIPQLEYLGYAMCDLGVQQLRSDEILDLFARMREEYPNVHPARNRSPEEFLRRLEARTGILVEAGHVKHLGMLVPVYEFRHLTFQEYLAARALVDGRFPGRNPRLTLASYVAPLAGRTSETSEFGEKEAEVVENWREALRLCANICSDDDVDDVLLAIVTPQPDDSTAVGRARAILATLCLADEPNASDAVAQKILTALASHVRKGDGAGSLTSGLDSAAVGLIATRWRSLLCGALLTELLKLEPEVHENCAGLLGMVSGEVGLLDEPRLGMWLAKQVDDLGGGNEGDAIIAALGIMHVAYKEKATLVPGLITALLKCLGQSKAMAHASAWALAWLHGGHRGEGVYRASAKHLKTFISFAKNPESEVCAVCYLSWIFTSSKAQHAAPTLMSWLNYGDANVRRFMAEALGKLGNTEAVPALIEHLTDDDEMVRRAVVRALGELKAEQAVDALLNLSARTDDSLRFIIARALGNIPTELAHAALSHWLDSENEELRRLAVDSLSQSLDEQDRELLSTDLDGLNPFLDPRETIGEAFLAHAVSATGRSIGEIRARYETLAVPFHLRLEWLAS